MPEPDIDWSAWTQETRFTIYSHLLSNTTIPEPQAKDAAASLTRTLLHATRHHLRKANPDAG
jgi:hypothetical protein